MGWWFVSNKRQCSLWWFWNFSRQKSLFPNSGSPSGHTALYKHKRPKGCFAWKKSAKRCSAMGWDLGGFWLKKELMHFMIFFRNQIWYRCTVKDRKCKMWNHEKMGKLNMRQVTCVLFVIIVCVCKEYTSYTLAETNMLPLKMHGWKMACLQRLSKTKLREIHSFTWSQVGTVFYHVGSLWI